MRRVHAAQGAKVAAAMMADVDSGDTGVMPTDPDVEHDQGDGED